MRFILFSPRWSTRSERNRLGAKEQQCAPGPSRQQTIPPRHHSGSRSVWRRFVPAAGRNASGLLRQAIVYCMLDFVEGRPRAGWKIVAGLCCSQNAPARFARIFRVCHISAIKCGPFTRWGTARVPLSQMHPTWCAGRDPRRQPAVKGD